MSRNVFLVFALCASVANSLAFVAPRATAFGDESVDEHGWTPAPTNAPLSVNELLRRQASSRALGSTILRASGYRIGWLSMDGSTDLLTCAGASTAIFQPAVSSNYYWGVMGCCDSTSCRAPSTCVNSRDYSTECKGSTCETDTLTLKCTYSNYPYCRSFIVEDVNVKGYFCDASRVFATGTLRTTSGNFTIPYSTLVYTQSSSVISSSTSRSSTSTPLSLSSSFVSASGTASNTASSTASVITLIPVVPTTAPLPVGPIVGGAVGGFAILAIVGFAIFFLVYRRRKQSQEDLSPLDYTVNQQQQALSPPIFIPGGSKHSSMHSQTAYSPMSGTAPYRGSVTSPLSGNYMSAPGFDAPHELASVSPTVGSGTPTIATGR